MIRVRIVDTEVMESRTGMMFVRATLLSGDTKHYGVIVFRERTRWYWKRVLRHILSAHEWWALQPDEVVLIGDKACAEFAGKVAKMLLDKEANITIRHTVRPGTATVVQEVKWQVNDA